MLPLLRFQLVLILRLGFALRSRSILVFWTCLELNILRFLPLMTIDGGVAIENSIKYFLIQRIASVFFLISSLIRLFTRYVFINIVIFCSIMLKLGAAPLHGWFLALINTSTARIIIYLSTTQKIIPLIVTSCLEISQSIFASMIMLTVWVVWTNGLSLMRLNNILGLSSIRNLLWFIIRARLNVEIILLFFILYRLMLLGVLSTSLEGHIIRSVCQISRISILEKRIFTYFFLSLGGLPPFLGFLGKVVILKLLRLWFNTILIILLVVRALIILLYYIGFGLFNLTISPKYKRGDGSHAIWSVKKLLFFRLLGFNIFVVLGI